MFGVPIHGSVPLLMGLAPIYLLALLSVGLIASGGRHVVLVVVTAIEALRAFDIAFIVNQGKNGLELLSILITNNSISESNRVGFGSSIAVILLLISLGPIIVFLSL